MPSTRDEVLQFWFGEGNRSDPTLGQQRMGDWFRKNDEFDAEIRRRFGDTLDAAARGELEGWADTPVGRLALVIVLDQFSRNAYRGDPRAFAQDARALGHTKAAIASGEDRELAFWERLFLYLPLEHSEELATQEQCMAVFGNMVDEADDAVVRKSAEFLFDYARRHHEIIARFGRFPHRNAVLGRTSTPEEEAFLREPNSSF
jgi:uncharacterized protein (DUF924 family)